MPVDPTRLCQIEIRVSDAERALRFYENVFGWQQVPTEIYEYLILKVPGHCPFGISLIPGSTDTDSKSKITLYFQTVNARETAEKAPQFGGSFCLGPKKLPGYGTIYQVMDPDGQRFGLFEKPDAK